MIKFILFIFPLFFTSSCFAKNVINNGPFIIKKAEIKYDGGDSCGNINIAVPKEIKLYSFGLYVDKNAFYYRLFGSTNILTFYCRSPNSRSVTNGIVIFNTKSKQWESNLSILDVTGASGDAIQYSEEEVLAKSSVTQLQAKNSQGWFVRIRPMNGYLYGSGEKIEDNVDSINFCLIYKEKAFCGLSQIGYPYYTANAEKEFEPLILKMVESIEFIAEDTLNSDQAK